eukprot:CAMPEP_0171618532 /NCGR_PEP_ID=MMETSP0990-20121206/14806_1 /TAXON_ID=483369 /ORGANISM="non described non described, Strain CCMP2098" /LENGTH=304 /DNA_ID=CAMNT_0012183361 /DNA_START=9 /DNA_END=923 /DNA_ORIENTATION=-
MKTTTASLFLLAGVASALPGVPASSSAPLSAITRRNRPLLTTRGGAIKTPKETFAAYSTFGAVQGNMGMTKMTVQSVLAGAFIALGGFLALSVGAHLPGIKASDPGLQKLILGAIGLPFGLICVVLTGGQLFTGNCALVTSAWLQGTVSTKNLVKNFVVSFLGNFAGVLAICGLVVASGLVNSNPGVAAVAQVKCGLPFSQAFFRGFLCNWMVCIALWSQTAASDLSGKIIGIWFPISSFVAMGFEHSVANMALIPLSMLGGAQGVSITDFLLKNLLPVTLGNLLGGAVAVACSYNYIYGEKAQ